MKKITYRRIMVTIPDEIWLEFKRVVPEGQRSQVVSRLIKNYILTKNPKETKSFWDEIDKHIKGDYSKEDPVKAAKEAWNYVD